MTVGIYEAHDFLITDINKVTNNFTCGECLARFTRAADFNSPHPRRALASEPISPAPEIGSLLLSQLLKKRVYPGANFGIKATCWLEYESRQRGIHIHHHRCSYGGERIVAGEKVDGYHPESKTVFQYHGCFWHGCLECFSRPEQRNEALWIDRKGNEITREAAYQRTSKRSEVIRFLGYNLVERWEHERPRPWWHTRLPPKRNETYPHAIVYNFEACQDKTIASNPTRDFSYESEHVPISVSIADTLNTEPEYICSKDPEELISLFYQWLVQRSALIKADMAERYMPPDLEGSFQRPTKPYQSMVWHKSQWSVSTQTDTTCILSESTSSPILDKKTENLIWWETGTNYVHKHTPFQVFGHHKLFVTRHQLWQMSQDVWR